MRFPFSFSLSDPFSLATMLIMITFNRSLIALSLIMSLLHFKPAPMYILDEIDAALDLSHSASCSVFLLLSYLLIFILRLYRSGEYWSLVPYSIQRESVYRR